MTRTDEKTITDDETTPSDAIAELRALEERRRAAELAGDAAALGALLTDDFRLVGPLGFVLDRARWLEGYATGALVIEELGWDEVSVREHGDTAIAIGVRTQKAAYRGSPAAGRFRATHIAVRQGGAWRLAGMHLSPISPPPGAPPPGAPPPGAPPS